MAIKKMRLAVAITVLSFSVQAGTMGEPMASSAEPGVWSVLGGLGYTWYGFGYHGGAWADPAAQDAIGDGQTALGRFAIARDFTQFTLARLGLELGVQSGNTMRLDVPQVTLDVMGGMPIQATIKPMLDLLATATTHPLMNTPAFGVFKAGLAYRRLQINDRVTVNDLSQVGFEVQTGLGAAITDRANLALVYQGAFNGSANLTVNTTTATAHLSNIPAQNGVLLTLSYML